VNDPTNAVASAPQSVARSPSPASIVLDGLIQFSDPTLCELQPVGGALMDGLLVSGDGRPITLGKVVAPEQYLPAFGAPSLKSYPIEEEGEEPEIEAKLPVSATWHGLTLVEIYNRQVNFSDVWSYSFRFKEPMDKVRAALNQIGFAFAADGKQPLGNSESAPDVRLSRENGQTSLDCAF
jgi:hypothetical protein